MNVKLFTGEIESLRPIAESWQKIAMKNDLGITIDGTGKFLSTLKEMVDSKEADLLVLYDNGNPVGLIGLQYFESPLSKQKMANEHFMYVLPEKRGLSSMRIIRDAKIMAKTKGCSHIIFNASNLASNLHDKLSRVYEKMGFAKFETCFITELE